jgi:tRNA(fMet)-specific endonuclease VapC
MGTLLDTTVFNHLERALRRLPAPTALAEVGMRLRRELGADEEVAMAAITASELLHGVHRADSAHLPHREAFVEAAIQAFPTIPFDLLAARAHARLWATLAAQGIDVGAHDRLVAATAMASGWRVATANLGHYERIDGIEVLAVNLST